jgi:hypothetical protein
MLRASVLTFLLLTLASAGARAEYDDPGIALQVSTDDTADTIAQIRELPPRAVDEVVWLARCIYSESNRSHEQRLVAWVVRNRVETEFRGHTYRDAILTPAQFSAFNTPTPRRRQLLNLTLDSQTPGWRQALEIAYSVYTAPGERRPFPITTRHFYSPVSMPTEQPPEWTNEHSPIPSASLGVLPQRFKFYDGVDQGQEPPPALTRNNPAIPTTVTETDKTSLKELRRRVRRRLMQGQVKRPHRPTVKHPSRPERQR